MTEKLREDFEARFRGERGQHRDIHEHLHTISILAARGLVAVEFGVRTGNSTVALLHGLERSAGGLLYSFDVCRPEFEPPPLEKTQWIFAEKDTGKLESIPTCDLLLIDSLHTRKQVEAELRHAGSVKSYIVLHDTVTWGENGECDQPGISLAIYEFLLAHPEWRVGAHFRNNNGLLILERDENCRIY